MANEINGATHDAPRVKRKKIKTSENSWIEDNIQKRECIKFILSMKDLQRLKDVEGDKEAEYEVIVSSKCCCGHSYVYHYGTEAEVQGFDPGPAAELECDKWRPGKNTKHYPTDAYGTIEFQGLQHPTKAEYVRLANDTKPETIVQLLCWKWNLGLPKLLITVHGGRTNFELLHPLKKVLSKGLLKAAKTTGAWILTEGLNAGVTRHVGDALLLERSQRKGRVVSIGIAPWGMLENNQDLIGRGGEVPYDSIASPWSKYNVLNNRHAYFLLADNGTEGRYGAEILLRKRLEKYITNLKLQQYSHSSIPVVSLVIEGGVNTIRTVLRYVSESPPVPVVVCDGSGRAADIIAFMHRYASESMSGEEEERLFESVKEELLENIKVTFSIPSEQARQLYSDLLQCMRRKHLITVFRISQGLSQKLDQIILTALLRSRPLTPTEQLSLALIWNRVDIARSEIFMHNHKWPPGALEEAMMQALQHDSVDFVKLLLENGVSMRKFLTVSRLEELYNTKEGPSNTLHYILRDVRPHIPDSCPCMLYEIGLVVNKLMGGAYHSQYSMNKETRKSRVNMPDSASGSYSIQLFEFPFNELLIWSVLTKRHQMALLMWQRGEEALAKALIAMKLYKAMAQEAAEDDLETEIYEVLNKFSKEFENISLKLLDYCHRQDDDQAQQLLTAELKNWSNQTCLSLAVIANHRPMLAHPCSQIILADLWMGGLRTRKSTNIKILIGLFCPFYITQLEFKSREELQLMPQTIEEHLISQDKNDDSDSDYNSLAGALIEASIDRKYRNALSTVAINPDHKKTFSHASHDFQSHSIHYNYTDIKSDKPLKLKVKLYEFYAAPITKFWAYTVAYVVFLLIFSYSILVQMREKPSWSETYAIAYILTVGCEKLREIATCEPVSLYDKLCVWVLSLWNAADAVAIAIFTIGLTLRLNPATFHTGRIIYCIDCIYWYLRLLHILSINKYLGPFVNMIGKMVKNMIYFVVLLLIVLINFGVVRQAIHFPEEEASWSILANVILEPYFMLFGEVYADRIVQKCGGAGEPKCIPGYWITPFIMAIYLLIANILLINLLIAVFNNIFTEINAVAHQVWMFERYAVVIKYEQKTVLPPPFIVIAHVFLLGRYIIRYVKQDGMHLVVYDNGLKLFLETDEMERLYDFEEECVEGYFREQDLQHQMSLQERIKVTIEHVDNINHKIEGIEKKESSQMSSLQAVENRIRELEYMNEQSLAQLGMLHFMISRLLANQNDSEQMTTAEQSGTNIISEIEIPSMPRRRRNITMTDIEYLNAVARHHQKLQKSLSYKSKLQNLSDNEDVDESRENVSTDDSRASANLQDIEDELRENTNSDDSDKR